MHKRQLLTPVNTGHMARSHERAHKAKIDNVSLEPAAAAQTTQNAAAPCSSKQSSPASALCYHEQAQP